MPNNLPLYFCCPFFFVLPLFFALNEGTLARYKAGLGLTVQYPGILVWVDSVKTPVSSVIFPDVLPAAETNV